MKASFERSKRSWLGLLGSSWRHGRIVESAYSNHFLAWDLYLTPLFSFHDYVIWVVLHRKVEIDIHTHTQDLGVIDAPLQPSTWWPNQCSCQFEVQDHSPLSFGTRFYNENHIFPGFSSSHTRWTNRKVCRCFFFNHLPPCSNNSTLKTSLPSASARVFQTS